MLLIGSGAVLLAGLIFLTFVGGGTSTVSPSSSTQGGLPTIRQIREFSLTNQAGMSFSRSNLMGGPWAVNLIFSRCPGPCTQLSGVMKAIQSKLPDSSEARLLSLTSDPEFDTPAVLSRYAEKVGADGIRWQFATGTRGAIQRLATEDLMLVLRENPADLRASPEDLFLHSTLIILVDRQGNVRSAVEGLEPGAAGRVLGILAELEQER
jgi:protein SCO1/2